MPETTTRGAGRDLGDPDLDSDSDRAGTGERGSSGVDTVGPNDQMTTLDPGVESGTDEFDDPDADVSSITDESSDPDVAAEREEGSAEVSDGAT